MARRRRGTVRARLRRRLVLAADPPWPRTRSAVRLAVRRTQPALRDLPGVAGADERREVALAALLDRVGELLCHQVVVRRALDVAEHPERQLAVLVERHPRQRERLRRVLRVLVVDEAELLDRLPVLEVEPVPLLVADMVEGAVVVDVAVLQDLD